MKDLYIGVVFAFLSAFTYALGAILVQLLEQAIPDFQLNLYRCIGQSILSGLLLIVKKERPLVKGKERIIFTTIVGISGAVGSVLIFVSVLWIPVGTSGSIFHAATIIFTLLGVWILRMEQISWRKMIVFTITLVGISLSLLSVIYTGDSIFDGTIKETDWNVSHIWINGTDYNNESRPTNTIGDQRWMNDNNHAPHIESQSTTDLNNTNGLWIGQVFGVILAVGSGLAQTSFILGEKKAVSCDPPVSGPVLSFWISVAGLPISIVLMPIFEKLTFVSNIVPILLVIGHAVSAGLSIIFICLALERAPGMVVSLALTSDLPIRVLAQYLVIPNYQPPGGGMFDIIGAAVVTLALCLPGIWDIIDKRQEKKKMDDAEQTPLQNGTGIIKTYSS